MKKAFVLTFILVIALQSKTQRSTRLIKLDYSIKDKRQKKPEVLSIGQLQILHSNGDNIIVSTTSSVAIKINF